MFRLGLVLAALTAAGSAVASSPDPKDLAIPPEELSKARELVLQLGDPDFTDRERARQILAKMGRAALPALTEGMNSNPNPEVRFRCQKLLPRAAAADLKARLDTFLADTDGKFDHNLTGWNEFREAAGSATAARSVFAELLTDRENRDLLLSVGNPPGELAAAVTARKQDLLQRRYANPQNASRKQPTAADLITLLFAESRLPARNVPQGVTTSSLFSVPGVSAAITNLDDKGAVYKAVVVHWLDTRRDATQLYQAVSATASLNLKEAAPAAARLLRMKQPGGTYHAQAAMILVRLEAKEYLPVLEGLHGDETVLTTIRLAAGVGADTIEIQLRDVALAASLLLTGQNPEDYGFAQRYKASAAALRFNYSNWHVAKDKRAAAFEKWKAWRADHPDADKAKPEK